MEAKASVVPARFQKAPEEYFCTMLFDKLAFVLIWGGGLRGGGRVRSGLWSWLHQNFDYILIPGADSNTWCCEQRVKIYFGGKWTLGSPGLPFSRPPLFLLRSVLQHSGPMPGHSERTGWHCFL